MKFAITWMNLEHWEYGGWSEYSGGRAGTGALYAWNPVINTTANHGN